IELPPRRTEETKSSPLPGGDDASSTSPQAPTSTPADAGADAAEDAAVVTPTVSCGSATCSQPTPDCCAANTGARTCVEGKASCEGVRLRCDERADCRPDYVCCLVANTGGPIQAGCAPASLCLQAGISAILCKLDQDCPASLKCIGQTSLGYKRCD